MNFNYNSISKYRNELMGLSIILIMICHNTMDFPGFLHNVNSGIKMLCNTGVDLFFLFSGFGCYYSFFKNNNVLTFYKKRLIRIFIPFLFVMVIYGLIQVGLHDVALNEFIWTYSLISFYTDNILNEWFIAGIVVLYVIFPIIYYLVSKCEKVAYSLIVLIWIVALLIILGIFHVPSITVFDLLVTRVPAFILGSIFAKNSIEDKCLNSKIANIILFIGLISVVINLYAFKNNIPYYWTIIRILLIFIGLSIIICWVRLRSKFENSDLALSISKALTFISGFTLEIYLVHEKLLGEIDMQMVRFFAPNYLYLFVINIIAIILSIILAKYIRKITTIKK